MPEKSLHLEVVNIEHNIFSGTVRSFQVTAESVELGIWPGHLPLLAAIQPGILKIVSMEGHEEILYISGGFLEVQRTHATILADTVLRGSDLDQAAAEAARKEAQSQLYLREVDQNYAVIMQELGLALAKLRAIRLTSNVGKNLSRFIQFPTGHTKAPSNSSPP